MASNFCFSWRFDAANTLRKGSPKTSPMKSDPSKASRASSHDAGSLGASSATALADDRFRRDRSRCRCHGARPPAPRRSPDGNGVVLRGLARSRHRGSHRGVGCPALYRHRHGLDRIGVNPRAREGVQWGLPAPVSMCQTFSVLAAFGRIVCPVSTARTPWIGPSTGTPSAAALRASLRARLAPQCSLDGVLVRSCELREGLLPVPCRRPRVDEPDVSSPRAHGRRDGHRCDHGLPATPVRPLPLPGGTKGAWSTARPAGLRPS